MNRCLQSTDKVGGEMHQEGRTLIELIIVLPVVLSLAWFSLDGLMVYRDEYLLHYALFHSLRSASIEKKSDTLSTDLQLTGLIAIGEKGTGGWLPVTTGVSDEQGRLASSILLFRETNYKLWPPASSELSTQKELAN